MIAVEQVIDLLEPESLGNGFGIPLIVQDGLGTSSAAARRIIIGRSDQIAFFMNQFRDEPSSEDRYVVGMRLDGGKDLPLVRPARLFPLDHQFVVRESVVRMKSVLLQILPRNARTSLMRADVRQVCGRTQESPGGEAGLQEVLAIHHGGDSLLE